MAAAAAADTAVAAAVAVAAAATAAGDKPNVRGNSLKRKDAGVRINRAPAFLRASLLRESRVGWHAGLGGMGLQPRFQAAFAVT